MSEPTHVTQIRKIVECHTASKVSCPVTGDEHLVDAFSASAFITIYDGLNDKNKAHIAGMSILKAIEVAFRIADAASKQE